MKMKTIIRQVVLGAAVLGVAGCASYRWTSGVPKEMRTVCVPTFRNETDITELGNVASRQILREFQREGTFRVARMDDAALEIQGVLKSAGAEFVGGDRRTGMRYGVHNLTVKAVVSVIDRRNGKVLIDNREYTAVGAFTTGQDVSTHKRNASGRVAEDLATRIVDDVLRMKW